MTNTKTLDAFAFNLQLFADGAGGAEGGAPAGVTAASDAGEQAAGVQGASPAAQTDTATVDLDAEYAELIAGKYKAQYDADTKKKIQNAVTGRLRNVNGELNKYKAFAATVAERNGFDFDGDIDRLSSSIEAAERPGLAERAYKNGVSEEVQKHIDEIEAKNKRYERERAEREREDAIQRQVAEWSKQAEALQAEFPGFDLATELQNEQFARLLNANVDVRGAYMATHYNEIIPNALAYTAKQVETAVVNKIRANGSHPAENGTSSQSAAIPHVDPSKLTKAQMEDLYRRAQRGEKIRF